MFVSSTREAIAELVSAGLGTPAIARRLDLAPTTVSYHVARLTPPAEVPSADSPAAPESASSIISGYLALNSANVIHGSKLVA